MGILLFSVEQKSTKYEILLHLINAANYLF